MSNAIPYHLSNPFGSPPPGTSRNPKSRRPNIPRSPPIGFTPSGKPTNNPSRMNPPVKRDYKVTKQPQAVWDKARLMYLHGIPVTTISKETGIPAKTIAYRIHRHDWAGLKASTKLSIKRAQSDLSASLDLSALSQQIKAKLAEDLRAQVDSLPEHATTTHQLSRRNHAIAGLVDNAHKLFDWGSQGQGGGGSIVNVAVLCQGIKPEMAGVELQGNLIEGIPGKHALEDGLPPIESAPIPPSTGSREGENTPETT